MIQAIHHALDQSIKPEMIVTGGDLVFDLLAVDEHRAMHQWSHFHEVFDEKWGIPIEHCLGNHDVWGIDCPKSDADPGTRGFGKQWALAELQLERAYRSFDKAGWHFIVLDGTMPTFDDRIYIAKYDEEQLAWLADDLANTPANRPVVVVTHEPILSGCAFVHPDVDCHEHWRIPASHVHVDAGRVHNLLASHGNVKLVLSGHLHLVDRVEYMGITYLCNGAVCGNWWNGAYQKWPPGYAMVDLYDDGTFANQFFAYDASSELPGHYRA